MCPWPFLLLPWKTSQIFCIFFDFFFRFIGIDLHELFVYFGDSDRTFQGLEITSKESRRKARFRLNSVCTAQLPYQFTISEKTSQRGKCVNGDPGQVRVSQGLPVKGNSITGAPKQEKAEIISSASGWVWNRECERTRGQGRAWRKHLEGGSQDGSEAVVYQNQLMGLRESSAKYSRILQAILQCSY